MVSAGHVLAGLNAASMTAAAVAAPEPAPGYLWWIPGAPFLAFAVIGILLRPWRRLSALVAISAISTSFLLSIGAFFSQLRLGAGHPVASDLSWFDTGTLHASVSLQLDPLSAVMLVVVTTVALMVQLYSLGYMAGEPGLSRYYAYLSFFCASMLGLVLARNFLQLFVCWELVGACSYLLIGFWYDRHAPAFAAKKAFVTTRLGDLGFLLGVLWLSGRAGTFDFAAVQTWLSSRPMAETELAIVAVLLFCGAVGKSAQVPLHVWLPDAMEGPTPVSALIHAATMVAAGVYMVARLFFLFSAAPEALHTVAWIGGVTAIFASLIALVQDDIKRVLAYSTISQLGYMMLGLGVGSVSAGMFHLFTHAFFKALLFLGAGAVIHAVHTNDMWKMGGLRKVMPWTFGTFVVGSLALAGFFPFSGFFSKDEILHHAMGHAPLLFVFGLIGSFCTSFYMARLVFVAFFGEPREHGHGDHKPHEVPWIMRGPLVLLASLAVVTGWWYKGFAGFVFFGEPEIPVINLAFAAVTQLVPLSGLLLAHAMYIRRSPDPDRMAEAAGGLYQLLRHRFYVDEAYDWFIDRVVMKFSAGIAWFDRHIVDGAVNGVAWLSQAAGSNLRYLQTGRVQHYAVAVFGGVVVLLLIARMSGAH